MKKIIHVFLLVTLLAGCEPSQKKIQPPVEPVSKTESKKPGSSFYDTIFVQQACSIFYYPDSVQKEKIKAVTDPGIFEGMMHEFFYQQRAAHIFLKEHWPHLKIIEVIKVRFLFFRVDNATQIIDLDSLGDSNGMIVFEPNKLPRQIDMTNIETEMPEYFKSR